MIKVIAPISLIFVGIAIIIASLIIKAERNKQNEQGKIIYTDTVSAMNENELYREYNKILAYNESFLPEQYELLDNTLGYIEIPALDIRYPILKGETEENLSEGIAHVSQTAVPVGTKGTTSVLIGHCGQFGNELFTHLEDINLYDVVLITILGSTYMYVVDSVEIAAPEDVSWENDENKANLILVTCTPYGVNSHRVLVRCSLREEGA